MPPKSSRRKRLSGRTLAAALLLILTVILLVIGGPLLQTMEWKLTLFGHPLVLRLHYGASMLILLFAMVPFFMVFEKRRPQARELIVIATLSAIAVLGRAIFFMLPNFKPVCAIVIIAGVCFGAEAGFLVGAVSGFVSNFIYMQGIHTPWQMVGFALVGFFAGLLFSGEGRRKSRTALCVYGFFSTLILYGGIINVSQILAAQAAVTWQLILAAYLSALPWDLIHACSSVVFLYLLSRPMIEKLERIKLKYGILEP